MESVTGTCDSENGPAGPTDCFSEPIYYDKRQWGVCVSNKYIKEFSHGKYHCRDNSATYCYYQCMLELHGLDSGTVSEDCACQPGAGTTPSTTFLPSWCYSPSGEKCSWYTDCLEQRYPCKDTEASYAVAYAQKFCDLYTDHYSHFSWKGQKWVDSVRKCLQVKLVPILRPYRTQTCQQIKDTAFASHSGCYVHPEDGMSFCDLNLRDKFFVFWTIKSAFVDTYSESMKGLSKTLEDCLKRISISDVPGKIFDGITDSVKPIARFLMDVAKGPHERSRKERDVESDEPDDDRLASEIINAIAERRNWELKGLLWYAQAMNDTREYQNSQGNVTKVSESSRSVTIEATIVIRALFDLNYQNGTSVNLTTEINSLTSLVQTGQLDPALARYGQYRILNFKECVEFSCNTTYNEVDREAIPDQHSGE